MCCFFGPLGLVMVICFLYATRKKPVWPAIGAYPRLQPITRKGFILAPSWSIGSGYVKQRGEEEER